MKATTANGTTYSAYGVNGQLLWQYDGRLAIGTSYIYLGKTLIASRKATTSVVLGNIDGISAGTNAVISGWACASGLAQSIDVHVYAGSPGGASAWVGAYTANLASEPSIQAACHSSGTLHRFSIALSDATRVQFGGKAIYIYGISPVGGANLSGMLPALSDTDSRLG